MTVPHIFVGLGNPGLRYARTRHNVGRLWIKYLSKELDALRWHSLTGGKYTRAVWEGEEVILVTLDLYMNQAGEALRQIFCHLPYQWERVWVAHDDLDLPFGILRLKEEGASGGHKGIISIYAQYGGSLPLKRIRFGIGRPACRNQEEVIRYVLSRFEPEEEEKLPLIFARAREAVALALRSGFRAAQNWLHNPRFFSEGNPK